MSPKQPRIVAELGRPETPEETAARKAAASRRHRENQTFSNLLVAIAACLGVVLVMVLVVLRPSPPPREPVDVAAAAASAEASVGATLIAPVLPEGFDSNAAEIRVGADGVTTWYAGYVTPAEQFVSFTQALDANPTWLLTATDGAPQTGERTVGGLTWTEHDQRDADDPGNFAFVLTTEHDASTVVIAGTAADDEIQAFAEAVSASLTAGE
ncbi:DUF4245 family protein [Agrococcus sp. Marseille-Q4369]|uniref:DUF4245 family protein n=1 Tax=Agrococcus sp. Marseille-Q4369 TaxID=2810513 RepID=UPI001B8BEEF9|nr:DUF4245 family protein [Agrococcus sp. Marseille-Q4369]QUW19724.1 DUF4245 domain-containing protein [Agrococcus sp. Marseille-Q4369]